MCLEALITASCHRVPNNPGWWQSSLCGKPLWSQQITLPQWPGVWASPGNAPQAPARCCAPLASRWVATCRHMAGAWPVPAGPEHIAGHSAVCEHCLCVSGVFRQVFWVFWDRTQARIPGLCGHTRIEPPGFYSKIDLGYLGCPALPRLTLQCSHPQSTHWQILAFCPLLETQNTAKDSWGCSDNTNPQDLHIKNQVEKNYIEEYYSNLWD